MKTAIKILIIVTLPIWLVPFCLYAGFVMAWDLACDIMDGDRF